MSNVLYIQACLCMLEIIIVNIKLNSTPVIVLHAYTEEIYKYTQFMVKQAQKCLLFTIESFNNKNNNNIG